MAKKKKKRVKDTRQAKKQRPGTKRPATPARASKLDLAAIVVANFLVLGTVIYVLALRATSSDFYYLSVQEDEYLEWSSFWAFMVAAGVFVAAALRQRRATGQLPWFLLGVSTFCFVVAMEEISWAQRIFSYRPPTYFLANNFQQELNVHNVISTSLRKLIFKGVILGYGVLLPLLAALLPAARKLLDRVAIVAPPVALAPAFFGAFYVYEDYPWSYSGEWVELMVGLGFLFVALVHLWDFDAARRAAGEEPTAGRLPRLAAAMAAVWLLIVGLGAANAALSRSARTGRPELLEAARAETEALKRDFLSGNASSSCDVHKRLYTFKEKYDVEGLLEGEFAALTAQGMPEERAYLFLDPWNYPYCIRDRCKDKKRRRITFVYSFGPNQRRDSTRWEILGDDVGAIIRDRGGDR